MTQNEPKNAQPASPAPSPATRQPQMIAALDALKVEVLAGRALHVVVLGVSGQGIGSFASTGSPLLTPETVIGALELAKAQIVLGIRAARFGPLPAPSNLLVPGGRG